MAAEPTSVGALSYEGSEGFRARSFYRWFWMVYFPMAASAGLILLRFIGLTGALSTSLLIIFALWSVVAVRLLVEAARMKTGIPELPILAGRIVWTTGLAAFGAIFLWLGAGNLGASTGQALAIIGGFSVLLAISLPLFALVDSTFRFVLRFARRVIR